MCNNCKKIFRDNYDIKRHNQRKFPCVKKEVKEQLIKNEEKNFIFGNEKIEENPIIKENIENEENYYILAVKFIIQFHKSLIKDNINIWLSSIKSPVGTVITEKGKEILSHHDIMDLFLKKRSQQLLSVLEKNQEFEENKMLKYNLEHFMLNGINHKDNRSNTSNMRIMIKIALLKKSN